MNDLTTFFRGWLSQLILKHILDLNHAFPFLMIQCLILNKIKFLFYIFLEYNRFVKENWAFINIYFNFKAHRALEKKKKRPNYSLPLHKCDWSDGKWLEIFLCKILRPPWLFSSKIVYILSYAQNLDLTPLFHLI